MDNNLGLKLKARRKEKGLKLVDVSKLSGLHLGHISHIERGDRLPTGSTLKKLAKPLGFTEIELFKLAGLLSSEMGPCPTPSMLTAREVAVLLNVHINTVRRWGNRGILKAYRISSRGDRRFRREDIDNFLQESKIGGN
ncbi:hypothetical protein ES703_114801 [subsurface metagenome]